MKEEGDQGTAHKLLLLKKLPALQLDCEQGHPLECKVEIFLKKLRGYFAPPPSTI